MLGKSEGGRRRGQQRMRLGLLDGITDSMDMNLSKLWEMVDDWMTEEPGVVQSMALQRAGHDLATEL